MPHNEEQSVGGKGAADGPTTPMHTVQPPGYSRRGLINRTTLTADERERLLGRYWKIRPAAGL
jgi:hypothetical protein